MANNNKWIIDNNKIQDSHKFSGTGDLSKFSVVVKRLKDKYSGKENLRMTGYYEDKKYGTVIGHITGLENDVVALRDIGFVIERVDLLELCKVIKANYYNLIPEERDGVENNISDTVVSGVVDLFRKYITDNDIAVKDGLYNIPVDEFKKEFNDSTFRNYNISDIKEALKINGCTKCNANRNDNAVKVDGANKRYISFKSEVIGKVGKNAKK